MTVRDFSTPGQRTAVDFGLLFIRLTLGTLFLTAGVNKVKGGVGNFVNMVMAKPPAFPPAEFAKPYLYALPWAEIVVGVCLLLGLFTRFTGLLTTLMLLSFMIAATGFKGEQGAPFNNNVVLLSIAMCLTLLGPGRLSVDHLWPDRAKKH